MRILSCVCLGIGLTLSIPVVTAQQAIWIEGETPSQRPAVLKDGRSGWQAAGWGRIEIISNAQVLHVNLSDREAENQLPEGGLVFGYDFTIDRTGTHAIWARIGYEFVRSEFDWRVDGGAWQTCPASEPTINIQALQTWNELAWIRLTEGSLQAGEHRIEFRHTKRMIKDSQGQEKVGRILHMLDCLCITDAPFAPHGKWPPGVDHRRARDKEAEKTVFTVRGDAGPDGRAWTPLDGLWQYASWEETQFPVDEATRLKPVETLPDLHALRWFGYEAPGGRDEQLPEHGFAHRYLLRTRLDVPADLAGRGCFLDVQRSNLIVSVFVNGQFAGSTDTFHTAWQIDLSRHLRAGRVNDLVLCFKDATYSLNPQGDASADGMGNRRYWNLPRDFLERNMGVAGRHDMPVAADCRTGILEPASLVMCGAVYTEDVFVKPSVKHMSLGLELTLNNPSDEPVTVQVENQVIPWSRTEGSAAVCRFDTKSVTLPAQSHQSLSLSQPWDNPRLWWPDNPYLYSVQTEIKINGRIVDTRRTRFGFREWDWSTHMFKINGVKWPMWADTQRMATPQEQIALSKRSHVNQVRYWARGGWGPMTRRETLNYFDETGMLVRSSGTFDGQVANYGSGLREEVEGQRVAKRRLWDAWRKQLKAWVKEERNHASIYIWSLENEIAYINVRNLGQWQECEPEISKASREISRYDPTRPNMVDGGNCLQDESLPVNGAHYTEFMNTAFRDFPDAAYTREHFYDQDRPQRGAWRKVPDRPIMGGEIYFANGYSTDRFATIGGDRCFIGMGETMQARGLWAKMLSEGYRWCEYASFHFWMSNSERQYWNSWSPVAVFCRQWNWTWGEETDITRTLKVFNSTSNPAPIDVTWSFDVGGERLAAQTRRFSVPCGEAEEWAIAFTTPAVTKLSRGRFHVTATRGGQTVFTESKPVRLLDVSALTGPRLNQDALAVFDPADKLIPLLRKRGILFTAITEYGRIPEGAQVIVVGPDALAADQSKDNLWLSLAAGGKTVVLLDQTYPLAYQAIPGDLKLTSHVGRFGFSEDLTHPIFKGLAQEDFFTWGNDHVVYRNVYRKGTRGGRSLFQCDDRLACTALFESPVNDGLLLLCQFALGQKLGTEAVAETLLFNILNYAADYKAVRKPSTLVLPPGDRRRALLESVKLEHRSAVNPREAIRGNGIAIVDASPENLGTLAQHLAQVDAFCERGGWLMLWGLDPNGLKAFNTLVGHNHVLRKFERERVLLSYPTDALASGLTLRDVVMDTGQKMYGWMALKTPDEDGFGWLVDHTDIAPFCTFPDGLALGKDTAHPGGDHEPRNMVNGFTSDDNWVFTYTTLLDQGHKRKFTLTLPKEEEIVALKIRPSKLYHPITRIKLTFDDDPTPVVAEIPVRETPIVEDIPIPGRKARRVTLEVAAWAERGQANIVVIDNLWLQVKRSPAYQRHVASLLNVGALMAYRKGTGGIFLNQLRLVDHEVNPDNAVKKATIVKTVLKNMGAVFAGSQTTVARKRYVHEPIEIQDSVFNAFVHPRGTPPWFAGGDLSALPVGARPYAGIDFFLSDFSTSPVPTVIMLDGQGSQTRQGRVNNLPIGKKADALFFLHTFHKGRDAIRWEQRTRDARERKRPLPEPLVAFKYVIHYEGGEELEVPVVYQQHVDHWAAQNPLPLAGADLAWVGPQPDGNKAAVWVMTWINPQPEKTLASIDIARTSPNRGSGAVFAISTGTESE